MSGSSKVEMSAFPAQCRDGRTPHLEHEGTGSTAVSSLRPQRRNGAASRTSTPYCPPRTGSPPPAWSAISVPCRPTRSSISSPNPPRLDQRSPHAGPGPHDAVRGRFEVEDSDEWTAVMAEYNREADA